MQSVDVPSRARRVWEEICKDVKKAVVFMNAEEQLHWAAGTMMMLQAGAINIKPFSSFESVDSGTKKAVFIVRGQINDVKKDILRDILSSGKVQHAVLFTDLPTEMHAVVEYGDGSEESSIFQFYEDMLCDWMGRSGFQAEVKYQPFSCIPITPGLFLLGSDFPLLPTDIDHLRNLHTRDPQSAARYEVEFSHLNKDKQLSLKEFCSQLNSFFEVLNINEDCFTLGSTSRMIASELASLNWAKNRRKTAQTKASLLLIDRTLDLASAVGHHSETLLDKIRFALPSFPSHHTDIAVDMSSFFSKEISTSPFNECADCVILPGCLSNPSDYEACEMLSTISTARHKEGLMDVNRKLVEAASSSGLPLKLTGKPGRVTAEQLKNTLNLFSGNVKAIKAHIGTVQISKAVADTLQSPKLTVNDSLLAIEKGLIQSLGDKLDIGSPSVLKQISLKIEEDLQKPAAERRYTLKDSFELLVFVYSLLEETDIESHHERNLKHALIGAILSKTEDLPDFLDQLMGSKMTEAAANRAIEKIFQRLRGFCSARAKLKRYRSLYESSVTSPTSLKPLLKQVTEQIFDPSKPELQDVTYTSTGFGNLLKSGFGLFKTMGKPRPNDNPLLIVMVIGGVTSHEVRLIKDTVTAAKASNQVIVGSTQLLPSNNLLHSLLCADNLNVQSDYSDDNAMDY